MGKFIRKKPAQFDPYLSAAVLNDLTYKHFYHILSQLALSIFEWQNLPLSMNAEWLEWCLFSKGSAALLYDPEIGFVNTWANVSSNLNMYGLPIQIECQSYDYRQRREVYNGLQQIKRPEQQAILVENMIERTPTLPFLQLYAMRMMDCQRSEDVNIQNQKYPYVFITDESSKLSVLNAYKQVSGNSPVIITDKASNLMDNYKPLQTDAPYVADKLQLYRRKIFAEALEFLGINCIVENKKERLVNAEANANNEVVNLNLMTFMAPRQKACRYFNEKYKDVDGFKPISIKVRSDLYNMIKQTESIISSPLEKNVEKTNG